MSKKEFLDWYSWLQNRILSAIDNVIATPFNNEQFIWAIENNRINPCSDPEDPYPSANHSSYAWLLRSVVACIAIFSVIFAIIILYYKKHRKKESASNYFFFGNLFHLLGKNKLEISLGSSSIPYAYLNAVTYFYNPDVYPIVLWYRRTWAFIRGDKDFYNLRNYLNDQQKRLKKTKQVLLEEIYQEINEKIILFINKEKNYGKWYTEKKEGKWFIRPPEAYIKLWQARKNIQVEENITNSGGENSNLSFVKYKLKELLSSIKDKNKIFLSFFEFIEDRLKELGDASFVYWIFVFLFYFIPGYCVVNGVVWPPILIAGIFLGAVWLTKVYKDYKEWQIKHQIRPDDSKEESNRQLEESLARTVKYQIKLGVLLSQRTEEKTLCKESRLCKEIREVIQKKGDFIGVRAIFNGFVLGCFTIYFSFWLLGSALALVVSCNSLIFPLVSLSLGLIYGICSARKYYKRDLKVLSQVENSFVELKKNYANIEIPDISLRACDRLFRRGRIYPFVWTRIKQFAKRFWIGFIKFGTGMLFLKLLPLGTTVAIMTAAGLPVTCSFFPMLGVMLAGGIFFAACHVWQYHCESKEAQAGRVMDFLLNAPTSLQDNPVCSEIVESNSLSYSGKCSVSTSVLNKNERAFTSLFNGSNRFLKLRRQSSNSEPCLNKQQEFDNSSSRQAQFCHANNGAAVNQGIEQSPFRKRSNTLPPDIRTKRQAIHFQSPETPHYVTLFKNCRDSESSFFRSSSITLSQSSLIASH